MNNPIREAVPSRAPVVTGMQGHPRRRPRQHAAQPERRPRPVLHPQPGDPDRQRRPHGRGRSARAASTSARPWKTRALVVGQAIGTCNGILNAMRAAVRRPRRGRPRSADLRPAHHHPRRHRRRSGPARPARASSWACRSPPCWAKASSATRSRCSAISSMSATGARPICPIRTSAERRDDWLRLRHEEAMTPGRDRASGRGRARALRIQRLQAEGRRAAGASEIEAVTALAKRVSRRRASRSIPNGAWSLEEADRACAAASTTCSPMRKIPAAPRTAIPAAKSWPNSAAPPACRPPPT